MPNLFSAGIFTLAYFFMFYSKIQVWFLKMHNKNLPGFFFFHKIIKYGEMVKLLEVELFCIITQTFGRSSYFILNIKIHDTVKMEFWLFEILNVFAMLCPLEITEMALSVLKKYLSHFTKILIKHLKPCHTTELALNTVEKQDPILTNHFFIKQWKDMPLVAENCLYPQFLLLSLLSNHNQKLYYWTPILSEKSRYELIPWCNFFSSQINCSFSAAHVVGLHSQDPMQLFQATLALKLKQRPPTTTITNNKTK